MQKTFQVALFFIFFINSISNCYEANQKRRMFCHDGYGANNENWNMMKSVHGFGYASQWL